jgi:hypothetical protein
MVNEYIQETPLHIACRSRNFSYEVIQVLTHACPEACLLINCHDRSPFDKMAHHGTPPDAIGFMLLEATSDAAIAIFECIFCNADAITIPPA